MRNTIKIIGPFACIIVAMFYLKVAGVGALAQTSQPNASQPTSTRPTISEAKVLAFFKDKNKSVAKVGMDFPGYTVASRTKNSLKLDDYSGLADSFNRWSTILLAPECIPSEKFVQDHIILNPATKDQPADAAYLPYRLNNLDCMIVQTGGAEARLYLFVRDHGGDIPAEPEKAHEAMLKRLKPFLREWRLPKFKVAKTDELWTLKFIYDHDPIESYYDTVKVLASKDDICFEVRQESHEMTPPWIPQGNQWFDYLKKDDKHKEK